MDRAAPTGVRHPLQTATEGQRVVVVGAGEQGTLAHEYLTRDSPHEVVAFSVERRYLDADEFRGLPLVAFEDLAGAYPPDRHRALVAVSSTQLNRVRWRLYESVKAAGFECISYVSSHAFVWPNVEIGENTFIFENNVIQHQVRIGDDVILWSGNHIGHQTQIGDHCFLASHVVVSGFCTIGPGAYLGVNATIANDLSLAEDCVIGAGAVVVKDTEARQVYVGSPARPTGRDSFATFGVDDS